MRNVITSVAALLLVAQAGVAPASDSTTSAPAASGAASATAAAAKVPAPVLEGTSWVVTVTPDAASAAKGEKEFPDTLVFAKGKVEMSECVKVGFAASDYKIAPVPAAGAKEGGAWSFATEQSSEKAGKTSWKAEISGDIIRGTLVSTRADGTVLNYSFTGKKAK